MPAIKFYDHEPIPMEMHKVKIVQQLNLLPAEQRLQKMKNAGFNTFQLHNGDIFMDMLTDSGVNAMSDKQLAGMMTPDDAYAGSESFYRMRDKLEEIFGIRYCLPAHQGRACENVLAERFVTPGKCVIMNYHFTTAKAHITRLGGRVEELVKDEGLVSKSDLPFKGDIDLEKLEACIQKEGADNVAYMRLESGTNLIGGQPVSVQNFKDACAIARKHGILTVLDASLLQDNLYFNKIREEACKDMTIREITREIADQFDIIYFSARKFGFARGGAILVRDEDLFHSMEDLIPMFEGFLTYGGMSVREMEAMTVGFDESMDMDVISQGPQFIDYCVKRLDEYGVPMITPGGGLGAVRAVVRDDVIVVQFSRIIHLLEIADDIPNHPLLVVRGNQHQKAGLGIMIRIILRLLSEAEQPDTDLIEHGYHQQQPREARNGLQNHPKRLHPE